jgi:hypothetical protein
MGGVVALTRAVLLSAGGLELSRALAAPITGTFASVGPVSQVVENCSVRPSVVRRPPVVQQHSHSALLKLPSRRPQRRHAVTPPRGFYWK